MKPEPVMTVQLTPIASQHDINHGLALSPARGQHPVGPLFSSINTISKEKILTFVSNHSIFSAKPAFVPFSNIFSGDTP